MGSHSLPISTVRFLLRGVAHFARPVWETSPPERLASTAYRWFGTFIYRHYVRYQDRVQSHYTRFLRNQPQLNQLVSLVKEASPLTPISVASIGCSSGAELYSLLWALRSSIPSLIVTGVGVDISPEAIASAQAALYRASAPAVKMPHDESELADLSEDVIPRLFAPRGDEFIVHDWIRAGCKWVVGDICDSSAVANLGTHDVVLANNFLGPMDDAQAAACLTGIVGLVKPGGYLVVDGVDLNVKCKVIRRLNLKPITHDLDAIYSAGPHKGGWPWIRWGLEPINRSRRDWQIRYSTIFKVVPPGAGKQAIHSVDNKGRSLRDG
ncbi:CheR family methyltransferase [Lysobacter niastensis]|uniref:Methyltransferase domain-containing protein n=1 Tax=Lysobacter niastensis TaxID=380629 RepID=A0ABS0B761_9GAMM|nr:CheR family methyltransferase [Lysobacter niastensis]MBF6024864.1 methyltransferase domain-containing protein [Lysobacter niastensis]